MPTSLLIEDCVCVCVCVCVLQSWPAGTIVPSADKMHCLQNWVIVTQITHWTPTNTQSPNRPALQQHTNFIIPSFKIHNGLIRSHTLKWRAVTDGSGTSAQCITTANIWATKFASFRTIKIKFKWKCEAAANVCVCVCVCVSALSLLTGAVMRGGLPESGCSHLRDRC